MNSLAKPYTCLTGSHLKLIAVLTMLIDHSAVILWDCVPFLLKPVLDDFTVYDLMRKVGRPAFPLFCFLLTEGAAHTKNSVKYGCSLLAFAILSEIPFNLMTAGSLLNPQAQNVFFTLLTGFLLIMLLESPLDICWKILISVPVVLLFPYLHTDYGRDGILLILMLHILRRQPLPRALLALPFLSGGVPAWCAFLPISLYNGNRGFIKGKLLKYAFYAFYPLHILLLYSIKHLFLC